MLLGRRGLVHHFTPSTMLRMSVSVTRALRPLGQRALASGASSSNGAATWADNSPLPNFSFERPAARDDEADEMKRKRLLYQSRKRGIVENDLILGTFAKEHLAQLSSRDLILYDRLLGENDWDIYYWVTAARPVPPPYDNSSILEKLRAIVRNESKRVMRLPELSPM